jgi:hypothetical protein
MSYFNELLGYIFTVIIVTEVSAQCLKSQKEKITKLDNNEKN